MVFKQFQSAGLTLRGTKCHIGVDHVKYLGHVFSVQGMKLDPSKFSAVYEWPQPKNATDLHSFLGLHHTTSATFTKLLTYHPPPAPADVTPKTLCFSGTSSFCSVER